jgi:hypothetical protein
MNVDMLSKGRIHIKSELPQDFCHGTQDSWIK